MKKYIAGLFTLLLLGGCEKYLDKIPDNRANISTIENVNDLLVTAYPDYTYSVFLEMRGDGMKDMGQLYDGSQPTEDDMAAVDWFDWNAEYEQNPDTYDGIASFWAASYKAATVANFAIQAIEQNGLTGSEADKAMAEARVARAYNHFMLLSVFTDLWSDSGASSPGIPYVKEPYEEVFKTYERGTVAGAMSEVEKDLFEEIGNLGEPIDYRQPKFHFTRSAALAFAVRLRLFQKNYDDVITYANQLIPNASILATFGAVNEFDGELAVIVHPEDPAFQRIGRDQVNWADASLQSSPDAMSTMMSSPEWGGMYLVAEQNTVSSRWFMANAITRYTYTSTYLSELLIQNPTGGRYARPIYSFGEEPGFFPRYFEDFKYTNQAAGIGEVFCKMSLFRLEEVLLSRAEAYVMKGEYQKALNDLNMYFQGKIESYSVVDHAVTKDKIYDMYASRVSDPESYINKYNSAALKPLGEADKSGELQRALLMAILDVRKMEFIYEGMRYFDILRWNIPAVHTQLNGARTYLYPTDPQRIIQLPEATVMANLEANPRAALNAGYMKYLLSLLIKVDQDNDENE